jgi:hypothetical protein
MDYSRISTITITHLDFLMLTSKASGNVLAEEESPEMLREAIKSGVKVIITDVDGAKSCQLKLNDAGQFQYAPLA